MIIQKKQQELRKNIFIPWLHVPLKNILNIKNGKSSPQKVHE
jgi:hypothetical protein